MTLNNIAKFLYPARAPDFTSVTACKGWKHQGKKGTLGPHLPPLRGANESAYDQFVIGNTGINTA